MQKKLSFFMVLLMLSVTALSMIFQPTVMEADAGYKNTSVSGRIAEGTTVEYLFTPEQDIGGFKFLIATYEKEITSGQLAVAIFDQDSKEELARTEIGTAFLRDNQFVFANTGKLRVKGKKIRVVVTGGGFQESEDVVLWMGENQLDEEAVTRINGIRQKDDVIVLACYLYASGSALTWELLLMTAVCFLIFVMQWKKVGSDGGEDG